MPIYEYNCQDCKQIFEDWQKDYEERELPCPVCGGPATRLISSTSFVLKGGGWYASGYNGGGDSPGAKPEAAAPTVDAGKASEPAKPCAKAASAPASTPASS